MVAAVSNSISPSRRSLRITLPRHRRRTSGIEAERVITNSIRSPGCSSSLNLNNTPDELISRVSLLRETGALPTFVTWIGSRSLYLCVRRWSKPQMYATRKLMATGNGTSVEFVHVQDRIDLTALFRFGCIVYAEFDLVAAAGGLDSDEALKFLGDGVVHVGINSTRVLQNPARLARK